MQNTFFRCDVGTIKRKRFHFRRIYRNRLLLIFKIGVYTGNNETFGFVTAFCISRQHVFLMNLNFATDTINVSAVFFQTLIWFINQRFIRYSHHRIFPSPTFCRHPYEHLRLSVRWNKYWILKGKNHILFGKSVRHNITKASKFNNFEAFASCRCSHYIYWFFIIPNSDTVSGCGLYNTLSLLIRKKTDYRYRNNLKHLREFPSRKQRSTDCLSEYEL